MACVNVSAPETSLSCAPSLPISEQRVLQEILQRYVDEGFEYHALRTRQSGAQRFVSLHVLVPPEWTVQQGHELLERLDPNPMVTLSRAVAVGMVHGPQAGLVVLASLDGDNRVAAHHRVHAVKAHLLEMAGDLDGALSEYRASAHLATNLPEQRYLDGRAAQLAHDRG